MSKVWAYSEQETVNGPWSGSYNHTLKIRFQDTNTHVIVCSPQIYLFWKKFCFVDTPLLHADIDTIQYFYDVRQCRRGQCLQELCRIEDLKIILHACPQRDLRSKRPRTYSSDVHGQILCWKLARMEVYELWIFKLSTSACILSFHLLPMHHHMSSNHNHANMIIIQSLSYKLPIYLLSSSS